MEVLVKVSSSYFEIDTSKYRLAISELTLIESLKQQTDRKFRLSVEVSAMDPRYTKRIKSFRSIGVPMTLLHEETSLPETPYIEVSVDDDTFLHKEMIQALKTKSVSSVNRRLLAPNGYVFIDGKLQVCSEKPDIVEINQFVEADRKIREEVSFTRSHCWIHVRHAENDRLRFDQKTSNEVIGLNWPGWQANVVHKFCTLKVVEGTAQGAELYPTRSKSVVYAHKSNRKRRKRG